MKKKTSKPPRRNFKAIAEVMAYRKQGLSFREIGRKMKKPVNSVYRWYSYAVISYPQK